MTDLVVVQEAGESVSVEVTDLGVVVTQEVQTVTVQEYATAAVEVLAVGPQGPKGDTGDGATTLAVGPSPLSGHTVVACNAAGLLIYADSTNPAHRGAVVGIIDVACSPGELVDVKTAYTVTHAGWSWTPGPVFVGAGGQLTQAPPPGAVFSQVVAHALSGTVVLVDIHPPITIT